MTSDQQKKYSTSFHAELRYFEKQVYCINITRISIFYTTKDSYNKMEANKWKT